MSYTVIGMFSTAAAAEDAKSRLLSAGLTEENVQMSSYKRDRDIQNDRGYIFREDDRTKSFWDHIFGPDDSDIKRKYSYAASRNIMVIAYADTEMEADRARLLMDDAGAMSVEETSRDYFSSGTPNQGTANDGLTEAERSRVLAKARYGIYMDGERSYSAEGPDGMATPMDSQGDRI